MANRTTRYQAAIMRDSELLLIRYELDREARRRATGAGARPSWWMFPGGGREAGESEEECVVREVREETHLAVRVERLLYEAPVRNVGSYRNRRCYLCYVKSGKPARAMSRRLAGRLPKYAGSTSTPTLSGPRGCATTRSHTDR